MEDEELITVAASLIIVSLLKKKKRKPRRIWVRTWLQRREEKSAYQNILQELRLEDAEHFRKYLRMSSATFEVSQYIPTFCIKFILIWYPYSEVTHTFEEASSYPTFDRLFPSPLQPLVIVWERRKMLKCDPHVQFDYMAISWMLESWVVKLHHPFKFELTVL